MGSAQKMSVSPSTFVIPCAPTQACTAASHKEECGEGSTESKDKFSSGLISGSSRRMMSAPSIDGSAGAQRSVTQWLSDIGAVDLIAARLPERVVGRRCKDMDCNSCNTDWGHDQAQVQQSLAGLEEQLALLIHRELKESGFGGGGGGTSALHLDHVGNVLVKTGDGNDNRDPKPSQTVDPDAGPGLQQDHASAGGRRVATATSSRSICVATIRDASSLLSKGVAPNEARRGKSLMQGALDGIDAAATVGFVSNSFTVYPSARSIAVSVMIALPPGGKRMITPESSLGNRLDPDISVAWSIVPRTAVHGIDFDGPLTGTISFLPGSTVTTLTIPLLSSANDGGREPPAGSGIISRTSSLPGRTSSSPEDDGIAVSRTMKLLLSSPTSAGGLPLSVHPSLGEATVSITKKS